MNQLVPALRDATPKARIGLAAGAILTLVVLVLLFKLATAPSYETVATGIKPDQAGKITAALDEQGITYELQNGGTAVGVQTADKARARIALAEQGAGSGTTTQPGFELFDKQKMGTSDFQQQVNYQRALEGEIASTIEQVQGVTSAKVQLVLPEDQLFAEDRKPATAAVLLTGDSTALDPSAIRGMAQLVSSSVEGLNPNKVTITDGTGALLWPKDGAGADGGTSSKLAAEQRYNQTVESRLTALLAGTVGADKAKVQVTSSLNLDKAKERKLTYAKKGVPLKTQTEKETLESQGGAGGGGRAGTASNVPGYAGGGSAGGGDSNYEREKEDTDFGVDKTVTDTEFATGALEKQSVAVVLDASVAPAVAKELQQAVRGAAGVDPQRGDTLTLSRVAFAKTPVAAKPSPVAGAVGYAKYAALGLGTLLFLFFITRHLRRREGDALGEPVWLREITAPQPLSALEAGGDAPTAVMARRNDMRRKAEEIAAAEPTKAAQQVRAWMQEDA